MEMYNPPHPGQILLEEFVKPLGLTITKFALMLGTPRNNMSAILNAKAGISPAMALKIEKALSSRAGLWLDMQSEYDLWQAKQKTDLQNVEVICG